MNIVIIGATSAIAKAIARIYAQTGASFFLVGRNAEKLDALASDLAVRSSGENNHFVTDLSDLSTHSDCVTAITNQFSSIDLVIMAQGTLSDQEACEQSVESTMQEMQLNALSFISFMTLFGNILEKQGKGSMAIISSVAGDRGRPSNYVYGSAKAMVTCFCQGLRSRLSKKGVNLLTIKPGFVRTPMTAHLNTAGPLWAEPDQVAKIIVKAIAKRKAVIYVPWFWSVIMRIIKSIPECLFKKLSL